MVVRRSGSVAGPGAGAEAGALFCAEESTHEIVQVQYTAWPDKAAPAEASALLQLIEVTKALDVRYNSKARAPWLVHCSAGVGRTGTSKTPDSLLYVHVQYVDSKKSEHSRAWFRSTDLWVMGPARFHCATLLHVKNTVGR